jgi:predicted membrane protein
MSEPENARDQRRQEREERREERRNKWKDRHYGGEIGIIQNSRHNGKWTGIFILVIGVAALLKATLTDFPDWVFSWQMLLIALGFFIGLRHEFRGVAWFILIMVGGVFLLHDIYPGFSFSRYIWPAVLIIIGLFILMRSRRRMDGDGKSDAAGDTLFDSGTHFSKDDFISSTSIFGGAKKIIISKNFKGGDLVNVFGGTELDLSQADFTGTAVIELTTLFGGTKMLVPSNWAIKSEVVTIFGGIEDKRRMQAITEAPEKTLFLKGTVIFGGIDIKSF